MDIDLIIEEEVTPEIEAMLESVLGARSLESTEWECSFLTPTKFETESGCLRVFVLEKRARFNIPFLRKKDHRAATTTVIETTHIDAFRELLGSHNVDAISAISENKDGNKYFTYSLADGSDIEVRHSEINLPYLQALHVGIF